MQRYVWVLMAIALLASAPASVLAADGKAIFETKCAKCHGAGGKEKSISPDKYASVQWERFFERNRHARKKDISAEFSKAELDAVLDYLKQHAADSDRPEASGLR